MLETTRHSVLVFSGLLHNRRRFLSHLSMVGINVDLCQEEESTIATAHETGKMILVDLGTSKWEQFKWLSELQTKTYFSEVLFVTSDEQSDEIQVFGTLNSEDTGQVAYYCFNEEMLFQNNGIKLLRVFELFAAFA